MKTKIFFVAVLALALMSFGCASHSVNDAGVTTKVKSKLAADGETSAMKIDVDTAGGVVTLSGKVATAAEKSKAEQIARNTEGVTQVVNNIAVDPHTVSATNAGAKAEGAADRAVDKASGALDKAADKAAGAVEKAGDKASDAAKAASETASDATILTKIKAQLLADGIAGTNVDVTDGAVALKGEVESAQEKAKAEAIAKQTAGVKSVKNQLTVKKK